MGRLSPAQFIRPAGFCSRLGKQPYVDVFVIHDILLLNIQQPDKFGGILVQHQSRTILIVCEPEISFDREETQDTAHTNVVNLRAWAPSPD